MGTENKTNHKIVINGKLYIGGIKNLYFYEYQIIRIFKLIPVVIKALINCIKMLPKIWFDMAKWDEFEKTIKKSEKR